MSTIPHGIRQRIVALLQDTPHGVDRQAIETALGTSKHLGDTLTRMAKPGDRSSVRRKGASRSHHPTLSP